jgi:hypothetical protein
VQIIEADQDRASGPEFFEPGPRLAGRPALRARNAAIRLVQTHQGREAEPAELLGDGCRQGKALIARCVGGGGKQYGLAHAWLALDKEDPALAPPDVVQQLENEVPLDLPATHQVASGWGAHFYPDLRRFSVLVPQPGLPPLGRVYHRQCHIRANPVSPVLLVFPGER